MDTAASGTPSLPLDEKTNGNSRGNDDASDEDNKSQATARFAQPADITQENVDVPNDDLVRETETSPPHHPQSENSPQEGQGRSLADREHTADTPVSDQIDTAAPEKQSSDDSQSQPRIQASQSSTPMSSSELSNPDKAQLSDLLLVQQDNDKADLGALQRSSFSYAPPTTTGSLHDAEVTSDLTSEKPDHPTLSSFPHDQSMEGRSSVTTSGSCQSDDVLFSSRLGLAAKVDPKWLNSEGSHQGSLDAGSNKGGAGAGGVEEEGERWGRGVCPCLPLRYVVVWTVFVGMVIINAMRTNVGVTVVTILNKESHSFDNNTGEIRELPNVDWGTLQIGYMHAIFYLGYMITHLPAGYLTTRLPSHKLFGGSIFVSCVLNLSLPMAIELGGYAVTMAVRFVQGLSEGLLYPACYGILRHWSTPPERGRLGSLVLTGAYLGPCVGFPVAGLITGYLGWEYIYYLNGGVGVAYVLLWTWLSEEKPAHHKKISQDELFFIEDLQGSEKFDYEGIRIPWSDILTSLPVMSLCLCNFARNWVFILMLTNEPSYLDMFNFGIAENGAFSAFPHVFKMTASLASGLLADFLMGHEMLTTSHTRKLLTAGFGAQAIFFIMLTQTTQGMVAMIFLTLAVGVGGFVVSGWQLNHYDLSTRHASVLVAVTSTFGNIASVGAPILAGVLTEDKSFRGWNALFFITSGITGLACLSFLLFGSGERQPWSVPPDTAELVIKQDSKRRGGGLSSPTKLSPPVVPTFTYAKLREAGEEGHVVSGHVPNYGSSQQTTPSQKLEQDGAG
ncbi:hypothetical protein V1264_003450 [Littorina saxatilis]|uniref:Major facilitator superfamily (MFS) profile domain-containing protein n=1 Tax=Littorina saxatilis TaxID=31220 RepID=A0AAN9B506_9CAEN